MSKNVLVISGADFSQCAVTLNSLVDYQKSEYKQTDGYYIANSIEVGTTTIDSVFTSNSDFSSYLVPILQGKEYVIKSYDFGFGSSILAWALVDSNNVILKYTKIMQQTGTVIPESAIDMSEYPTAGKLLICCHNSGTFPKLVLVND